VGIDSTHPARGTGGWGGVNRDRKKKVKQRPNLAKWTCKELEDLHLGGHLPLLILLLHELSEI